MDRGLVSEVAIQTPDQRLRVFVSSTLEELADERRAVSRAVSAMRLAPVMFELGARPHPPQELYRAYLAQSHVFVGMYWQRYGWISPGMQISGLEDEFLLILDNLEQVVQVAGDIDELLARCPRVAILATSRTVLGLRAEREYPVPPLTLPTDPATVSLEELESSPTVALFMDRARAVRPDFALTADNAAAVAEICRRLEGLPLAIELAAARIRLLDPAALLDRLARSLDALGTGMVDLPERQRTLRATAEWSVGLLDDAERSLLEVLAVFTDGWTIQAAAQVAGLDEDQALELSEALARHSLIYLDSTGPGPRSRMLETIRAFVAERLVARPDADQIGHRHADYYRTLAEQADPPLRRAGQHEWLERLQAEAGNLAAAVRWYLAHDRDPLPHLFRALWLFWSLRDHLAQARAWIDELLPTVGSLDPHAQAELQWTAAVTANRAGDRAAAQAASQHLESLLAQIDDPYLHAVSVLATGWAAAVADDPSDALRQESISLAELRGQDEPYWTASAVLSIGTVEAAMGRDQDAVRDLNEARELADRYRYDWLATWSRVQLGTLDVLRGRPAEADRLLDEALDLSLAARSTPFVTLCLAAYARLAFGEGDPERTALLEGAADGLRRRVGLRTWPMLRPTETELKAQLRQALGADRFDQAFAAGARLNQQQAVAAIRDPGGTGSRTA
jgi:predicted ATPase